MYLIENEEKLSCRPGTVNICRNGKGNVEKELSDSESSVSFSQELPDLWKANRSDQTSIWNLGSNIERYGDRTRTDIQGV